jgi:hypothetical protein
MFISLLSQLDVSLFNYHFFIILPIISKIKQIPISHDNLELGINMDHICHFRFYNVLCTHL